MGGAHAVLDRARALLVRHAMRHLGYVFLLGFAMLSVGTIMTMSFLIELHFPFAQSAFALLLLVWGSELVSAAFAEHQRRHTLRH